MSIVFLSIFQKNYLIYSKFRIYKSVGLSNILNSELNRRKPVEGPHGQVVGTAVVKGKLL